MKSFFNRETVWFLSAVCVLSGVYGLVSGYSKAHSPEEIRKRALVTMRTSCVSEAKRTLQEKEVRMSDSVVDQYCTCAMGQTINALTDQQVLDVDAGKAHIKDVLGPRYSSILSSCSQEARLAAGLPAIPVQ